MRLFNNFYQNIEDISSIHNGFTAALDCIVCDKSVRYV